MLYFTCILVNKFSGLERSRFLFFFNNNPSDTINLKPIATYDKKIIKAEISLAAFVHLRRKDFFIIASRVYTSKYS